MEEHHLKFPGQINQNTYISLGLLVVCVAGFLAIFNAVYTTKMEIMRREDSIESRLTVQDNRLTAQENVKQQKETWSDRDMFRWAVHLQRDNPQIKVPEPEMNK